MKTAFIFPGQGAQKVGMGKALADTFPLAKSVFEEADRVLGARLSSACFEGPEEELMLTAITQPAILTTSIAVFSVAESAGLKADFVAGHSLGEYSALVAAGSLEFAQAVELVRQRGRFMQEAVPQGVGAMAAIIGCESSVVQATCIEASERGVCSMANLNSSNQTVIAGHKSAVEHAVELLKNRGARKTIMLAVSAPFHCELMRPAAERLEPLLRQAVFNDLAVPLVSGIDAEVITRGVQARSCLVRQITLPVNWKDSVLRLIQEGVTRFVEMGPGKVLSGLVRQIDRNCEIFNIDGPESLEQALAMLG
jgi:[acyl-carrier-protein] S-malonyltransferase